MKQQRRFTAVFIGLFSLSLLASMIGFLLNKVTAKSQFKTSAATFSLTGKVLGDCIGCKPPLFCPPYPGVTITFTKIAGTGGAPPPVQTDAAGQWSQVGFEEGTTYRVTPGGIQSTSFIPPFLERVRAETQTDFQAYASYSVSGRVVLNGLGMDGVTIHVIGPEPTGGPCYPTYYPWQLTGQTDANGYWTVSGVKAGIVPFRAYPVKTGYVFSSCPQWFPPVTGPVNFEASPVSLAVVSSADFNYRPGFCSYPTVAQESIVSAFGSNLAVTSQIAASQPLPTELAGTIVKLKDIAGIERDAPLFFVSPTQINLQIPPGTSQGTASIAIVRNGMAVNQGNVNITSFQFALFTADTSGKGLPAAVIYRVKPDGSAGYEPVSRFDSAQGKSVAVPIDVSTDEVFLALFGTGGLTSLQSYEVTIGGTPVEVTYVGRQPDYVGLIQTNLRLPRSLAGRGEVELKLRAGGIEANPVTINVR